MNPKHDNVRHAFVLLMTLLAGCVDAVSFVNAGVFPANMSGNAIVLAVSLFCSCTDHREAHASLALLGFCAGSAVAAMVIRSRQTVWSRSVNLVLLLAGLILVAAGVAIADAKVTYSLGILFLLAVAMGMQAAAVLHLNFPGAGTTTAVTSTLTAVVTRAVHHLRGAMIPGFAIQLPSPVFPLLVFIVYFSGALIGGLQRGSHASVTTMLCGVLLAFVGLAAEFLTDKSARSS